ncbi:MAG: hypothetical protein RLZZ179_197 [Verrucomicrobiota bacterium]|jgi:hypothetical protein
MKLAILPRTLLFGILILPAVARAETVFAGAGWRYWYGKEAPEEDWRGPGLGPAVWKEGKSPLGYGEATVATKLDFGKDPAQKPVTAFFRRDFPLRELREGESLYAMLAMDDGAVVYLNGKEVARLNLPRGEVKADTTAVRALADSQEGYYVRLRLPGDALKPGEVNTLAVEVHQCDAASSDLFFDLSLKVLAPQGESVKVEGAAEKVIRMFRDTHRIGFDVPVPDGYLDGGRRMKLAGDGTATSGREILLVDRAGDPELQKHLAWAAQLGKTDDSAERKLRKLVTSVHDLNTPDSGERWLEEYVEDMTGEFANRPLRIGAMLEHCGSGVCRHRSLLLKILGDAAGLPTALVRGNYHLPGSEPLSGPHAWNEVQMPDGRVLLVDVMHHGAEPKFRPTDDPEIVARYLRENDRPWYGPEASQNK